MKRLAYLVLFGALTVNVAACGDDDDLGGGADAGDGVDGDVEPTVGSCGVNVFSALLRNGNGGGPNLAGVPVVFNAPNGQLLGAAVTDVKGAASIDNCVRGTSITFVINRDVYDCRVCGQDCRACGGGIPGPIPFPGPGNRYDIYTYAGANPGDTFYYSADYDEGSPPLYADLNVILSRDLSGFPIAEGSYTMDLQVGDCSSGIDFGAESIPDPLNIYRSNLSSSCVGETRSDVDLIVWLSGSSSSGFDPFEQDDMDNAYAFLKDVPITEGTNLETFVNEATTGAWMGLHKDNVHTVFNPLSAGYVSGRARHYVDGVQMGGSASQGVDYDQEDGEIPPPASADDWRGLPMGFGEETRARAYAKVRDADPQAYIVDNTFGPFNPNPVSSLTDGLPVIEGVVITDLASGRPALQWLAEGGARGDLGYFRVEFSSFELGGAGSWTLVTSDPASGEFRAPQLPPEIQALLTEPSLSVEFDEAAFADFDFADFAQILGTEGFVPDFLASCSNDLRFLEGDSTEGRTRRSVLGGSCSD